MKNVDVDDVCSSVVKFTNRAMFECATPTINVIVDIARHGEEKNIRMAVTSSQKRELVVQYLSSAGILSLFDVIVTVDDAKSGKPSPDIFLEAARRLKCTPAKCMGFEYNEDGLTALRAADMHAVDVKLVEGFPTYSDNDVEATTDSKRSSGGDKILGMPLWTVLLAAVVSILISIFQHERLINKFFAA
jgi:beta-phosphoglucomutase-like phosphatase (HAD superfamily)